jgi:hypothetical protein
MTQDIFNNIGIGCFSFMSVLEKSSPQFLLLSKAMLIMPIVIHKELITYLASSRYHVTSIEKLLIDKPSCFSNFSKRYYNTLPVSLNSIQLLTDIGYLQINSGKVQLIRTLPYNPSMGKRALTILKASSNIAKLFEDSGEALYLNMQVKL